MKQCCAVADDEPFFLSQGSTFLQLSDVHRDRFLTEHMLSRLQSFQHSLVMQIVRRRNIYNIYILICEHLVRTAVYFLHAELFRILLCSRQTHIAYCVNLSIYGCERLTHLMGNPACPQNSPI